MTKTIVPILLIIIFLPSFGGVGGGFSQPVQQQWVQRINGPFNDGNDPYFQVDKNGNSYVAGTHVINDTINILCVKYNPSGVQQWYKVYKFPGYGFFVPYGLALDTSGNAYVISAYATDPWTDIENGSIIRFNSLTGNIDWAKKYAGYYGWSEFEDIKIDRMNNIYVAGWSDSSHIVIRYNTNGDSVWVRKYHPPHWGFLYPREVARACTLDDSLNIIFTGVRIDYYPSYGEYDSLLVAKYSSNGNLRWESVYAYDYLANNVGTKIIADQNGNLYIGGSTAVIGHGVYLTMKYDRNGVQQWAKIYQGPGSGENNLSGIALDKIHNALFVTGNAQINGVAMATTIKYNISTGDSIWVRKDTGTYKYGSSRDINVDTSGNIYITGGTSNIPPGSISNVLTIKYSPQGNRVWLITYSGPFNADGGYALRLDNANNVYVMGESQSSPPYFDYIVIKYSQLQGIHSISKTLPNVFRLEQNYPNPFNPSTKIRFQAPLAPPGRGMQIVSLEVYDLLGRKIATLFSSPWGRIGGAEYELTLDAAAYSSGVYFYQLIADGNIIETKKMILNK